MPTYDKLSLFIFIDAFGWDILNGVDFLEQDLPYRRKLRSVMGYSSTAVPSILTGRYPAEHGHFSFYYYDPVNSPFKWLRPLRFTPDFIASRARVRNKMSQYLKRIYGFTGYFQIYSMPFKYIHLFDYCEKKSIFAPDGIINGDNIFTKLELAGVDYHVSDWHAPEEQNFKSICRAVESRAIEWAFFYNADLDGILHIHGAGSSESLARIGLYRKRLNELFEIVKRNYRDCDIYVFSDHGMANTTEHHELWREVDNLGFRFGRDYAAVYDSSMARFWFFNQDTRNAITRLLNTQTYGRILSDNELKDLKAYFPDAKYGELFFMLHENHLIVPSFMGRKPIKGMHGYHPDSTSSYAMIMSNRQLPSNVQAITDIYSLMAQPLILHGQAEGRHK